MKSTYTLMLHHDEVDVDFEIEADITYEPAFISGLPENCYPDSSECVIQYIRILSNTDYSDSDILDALEKQIGYDKITTDLWEDYMDRDDTGREDYEADRADQINDERKLAGEWE